MQLAGLWWVGVMFVTRCPANAPRGVFEQRHMQDMLELFQTYGSDHHYHQQQGVTIYPAFPERKMWLDSRDNMADSGADG